MSSPSKKPPSASHRASANARAPLDELLYKLRGRKHSISIAGVPSSARGQLLSELRARGLGPFVCVTADEEMAERFALELRLFFGSGTRDDPAILSLPGEPLTPYELPASHFKKRSAKRLFALAQLARSAPFEALILSAPTLLRRQVPSSHFMLKTLALKTGDFLDRDRLLYDLTALGFQSVPLVEDPGTFAARGTLLDLFSPLSSQPARLEFFGDELESIRLFDPTTQRAHQKILELRLARAQELVLTPEAREHGIATILELSEHASLPSGELRALTDDIAQGILPAALTAIHPGFFEKGLDSLFDFFTRLSKPPIFFFDDPRALEESFAAETERLEHGFMESRERGELALPPVAHALSHSELLHALQDFHLIENHALIVDEANCPPIHFTFESLDAPNTSPVSSSDEVSSGSGGLVNDVQTRFERAHRAGKHPPPDLDAWIKRFSQWRTAGFHIVIVLGTQGQADKVKRLLEARNLRGALVPGPLSTPVCAPSHHQPSDGFDVHLHLGELSHGFVDPASKRVVITEVEFLGHHVRRRRAAHTSSTEQSFVQAFQSLREGDLVVHADYGIGRYEGLTRLDFSGMTSDVMIIQYAGKDRVYLPVSRLRLVQKFTGAKSESVSLDRLGSLSWEKRKRAVKEQLLRMASELLNLEAARKTHPGHAFKVDEDALARFEAGFPFEETPDQKKAIDAVLTDMNSPTPMDRLVCGDVGFGKTEVALRAAFQAVNDGKQVALLVPTTVLAAQHLTAFRERFKDEPVRIEMISRLRSGKENRTVLDGVAQGVVDIVIGTHRLLGSDVSFADLGLLIIDEEHRFGVTHKEKLKRLRQSLDVLTLTATPIPRTLNLALSGLRQMSIIASPPLDRKAIRTFVIKDEPARVAEAIRFELKRGGQVFFVHNRVETIAAKREALFRLVPEARLAVAHGQMEHGELEKVMTAFASREIDVLVCSSIIESGLDIPSANTILIERADTFGLAQLYQIRGRVGRSTERAYGYLLIPSHLPLRREAAQRLEVLQSFTELGAGFHIAAHDLEIRGAGNLLGKDQSGQIAAVGFELYCELLEQAVGELKGEPPHEEIEPEVNLPIPAYFPEEYLPDLSLRLVFYKRLAEARDETALEDLRAELRDRFGELPLEVERLIDVMALKVRLRRGRLRALESGIRSLILTLGPDTAIDPAALTRFVQEEPRGRRLTPQMKLVVAFQEQRPRVEDVFEEAHRLLDAMESLESASEGERIDG